MFVKRNLPVILVAGAILWALSGSRAIAWLPELDTASVTGGSHLGGEIVVSAVDNEAYLPSVAYNWKHHEYMVVWHTKWSIGTRDIRAARISDTGQVLSTFTIYEHATKDSAQPAVAYDSVNDRYLVVWVFDAFGDGSDWDLYGRFIPWDGPSASLNEFAISTWNTHQWNPKIAYGRTMEEFLVVWANEYQAGSPPMYISGRRVKAADGSFPGGASDFTINHTTESRVNPDVTYNLTRNEYLVVYDNAADIFGMRLAGDISQNFGGEFGIAGWPGAETRPSVAVCWETDQYLVAWQNPQPDIYVRFIKGDGSLDGAPLQLISTGVAEIEPQVACNVAGNRFLAVWQQQFSNTTGPYGVWSQFVNSDKTLGENFGIISPTGGITAEFTMPVVAGGNVNYLTVWEHDRAGTAFQDIYGRLVTPHTVFLPLVLRN